MSDVPPTPPTAPRDAARAAIEAAWTHAWRSLRDDPEFVRLMRAAASALIAATEPKPAPAIESSIESRPEPTPPAPPADPRPTAAELAGALTFARPAATPAASTYAPAPISPPDLGELPRLADRFAARAVAQADATPTLSRTFANVAEALRLTHALASALDRAGGGHEPALRLLAESLSAALGAVQEFDEEGEDGDDGRLQFVAYGWLLRETKSQHIYIDRHMRRDDAARPADAADLAARIVAARRAIDADRGRRQAWNKFDFHRKRLADAIAVDDRDGVAAAWSRVAEVAAGLVRDRRVPPSDVHFRDALAGVLPTLPDEFDAPAEFERVLRAIDAHAASRIEDAEADAPSTATDDDVARVRAAIAGRTIVLIGGQARPHTRAKLEDALGVRVVWAESREHESPFNYAAEVVRPEVAVVVLTIRWMSHAFRDVTPMCRAHGVPVVSLKAGSNPARVARAIREQAGQRLGIDPG